MDPRCLTFFVHYKPYYAVFDWLFDRTNQNTRISKILREFLTADVVMILDTLGISAKYAINV